MATKKATQAADISVMEVERGRIDFMILGHSPLICNAMSAKIMQELLLPRGRKTQAERQSSLKHDPRQEFVDSMYMARNPDSLTRIVMKATSFKNALRNAAIDMPGSTKAEVGRLSYVVGDEVEIFGLPQLMMSVVRNSDMNKTPDVRTRAIIPEWACKISVEFTKPIIKEQAIINLLSAAGMTNGIGDWRPQKGSGNYGRFGLVGENDKTFMRIVKEGGKKAQDAAISDPLLYDSETEQLIVWFDAEANKRGFKPTFRIGAQPGEAA